MHFISTVLRGRPCLLYVFFFSSFTPISPFFTYRFTGSPVFRLSFQPSLARFLVGTRPSLPGFFWPLFGKCSAGFRFSCTSPPVLFLPIRWRLPVTYPPLFILGLRSFFSSLHLLLIVTSFPVLSLAFSVVVFRPLGVSFWCFFMNGSFFLHTPLPGSPGPLLRLVTYFSPPFVFNPRVEFTSFSPTCSFSQPQIPLLLRFHPRQWSVRVLSFAATAVFISFSSVPPFFLFFSQRPASSAAGHIYQIWKPPLPCWLFAPCPLF